MICCIVGFSFRLCCLPCKDCIDNVLKPWVVNVHPEVLRSVYLLACTTSVQVTWPAIAIDLLYGFPCFSQTGSHFSSSYFIIICSSHGLSYFRLIALESSAGPNNASLRPQVDMTHGARLENPFFRDIFTSAECFVHCILSCHADKPTWDILIG